ncbi:unnamed protein product [Bursaphelenchus okinawaensis]|uniref:Uncharacterized protein n=1 Tax=Bursaphelenchus okinawaensis TaxID=465554 RepID=A0A811L8A5_9BILA|nr:unnamed protein product [Bursaphelenchus okinawaensis]CAG9118728.1 unnamed protein product [Bursaphelenchus okinawaensis]
MSVRSVVLYYVAFKGIHDYESDTLIRLVHDTFIRAKYIMIDNSLLPPAYSCQQCSSIMKLSKKSELAGKYMWRCRNGSTDC